MRTQTQARQEATPSVLPFEEQMIVNLRNRFFQGIDSDILVMQAPMRRLNHIAEDASYAAYVRRLERLAEDVQAEQASYERCQRRLIRFVNKMGVEAK